MKEQKKTTKQRSSKISRRDFMGGAAAAMACITLSKVKEGLGQS